MYYCQSSNLYVKGKVDYIELFEAKGYYFPEAFFKATIEI